MEVTYLASEPAGRYHRVLGIRVGRLTHLEEHLLRPSQANSELRHDCRQRRGKTEGADRTGVE